ncbi:MAG: hypothetical protein WC027_02930 [Candidatus Paceibacterota bacterium]
MYNPEKPIIEKDVFRKAEAIDIPMISELLAKSLAKNLPEEEKKDGLYYEPNADDLLKIINDTGIQLCIRGDKLKGYFITMSKELAQTIPFEHELLANAQEVQYKGKSIKNYNYALLAQICIAKEFRGGRTFYKLHQETQEMLADQGYEIGLAEISDKNTTSLAVHRNHADVGTYIAISGMKWHIFVVDLIEE